MLYVAKPDTLKPSVVVFYRLSQESILVLNVSISCLYKKHFYCGRMINIPKKSSIEFFDKFECLNG